MGKRPAGFGILTMGQPALQLLPLAVSFLLGGVAGCLFAFRTQTGESGGLSTCLEQFLRAVQAGERARPDLPTTLWQVLRWPLFTWLLGLSAVGTLGIPVLFAVRGFLLSFSIASFVDVLGRGGSILAFLLLGVPALAAVPALFVLGRQSLAQAGRMAAYGPGAGRLGGCPLHGFIWIGGFLLCILLEYLVLPEMLLSAAGLLAGG